jgi:membrane protease YdiL (CAAX protease family)
VAPPGADPVGPGAPPGADPVGSPDAEVGSPDAEGAVDSRRHPTPPSATFPLRGPQHPEAANAAALPETTDANAAALPETRGTNALPETTDTNALPEAANAAALPGQRVLRDEVALVLALSLAASALYAIVDILSAPIRGVEAPLFADVGLVYQLLNLATSLVPVALVLHLLHRSGESAASIGLDATQPWADLRWGVALAALVGGVGLGIYILAVGLGVNRTVIPIPPTGHWWTIPVLLLAAARAGLLEEVIVCGYLLRRLDQLGWSPAKALWTSALLRGAYHLYQGFGGFFGNLALGLFFGRIYQLRGRTTPLVIAHFLIDATAGLGYLALRGQVWWLPG